MSDVFKMKYNTPNGPFTSVVLDKDEFEGLVDELSGIMTQDGKADVKILNHIKEAGHIPMMGRGSKTDFVFERYLIDTDIAGFMVRGQGREVLASLLRKGGVA